MKTFILLFTACLIFAALPYIDGCDCETPCCCPDCNYACPPNLCSCYFPGSKVLLQPKKVVRPANCPGCAVCKSKRICPAVPAVCTAEDVQLLMKYDQYP